MKYLTTYLIVAAGVIFFSCETKINPALESADPILVVDAWINNKSQVQVINLTRTQAYFDNALPPAATGATVTITDNLNKVYTFNETKPGIYSWTPVGNQVFGNVGETYKLTVLIDGEQFEASSRMGPVPPIDTIFFKKNESTQLNPDFYRARFMAKDVIGKGDTYWIRTYKNGVLLNKPSEINVAYDAGFAAGGNFFSRIEKTKDGRDTTIYVDFIVPIRERINPNDKDANDKAVSPYMPGDSAYVEIHSTTVAAFDYLTQVSVQTNRPGGFSELFARPIANVSTNIVNVNPSGKKAVGFFNVAAVSGRGQKFKQ